MNLQKALNGRLQHEISVLLYNFGCIEKSTDPLLQFAQRVNSSTAVKAYKTLRRISAETERYGITVEVPDDISLLNPQFHVTGRDFQILQRDCIHGTYADEDEEKVEVETHYEW